MIGVANSGVNVGYANIFFLAFSSNLTACINMCGLYTSFMLHEWTCCFGRFSRNEVHEKLGYDGV